MLKGISPIFSPELLKVLYEMGHTDKIILADGNFAAAARAKDANAILIRMDGHNIPELLDAVLQVFPLDKHIDHPAMLMGMNPGEDMDMEIPIWDTYKEIVARYDDRGPECVGILERYKYYEEAKKVYAIVATSEMSHYANILLQKGALDPQ